MIFGETLIYSLMSKVQKNSIYLKQKTSLRSLLELGGIPVHTEYRCLFFLRYEFLKYRNTGVI